MLERQTTAVLGAGLAGLAYTHFTDQSVVLYEQQEHPGGLCRSFPSVDCIPTDIGPHIFFSWNSDLLAKLISFTPVRQHRRINAIWHDGRFIDYPFENYLGQLSRSECEYCRDSFLAATHHEDRGETMKDFFLNTFGEGICSLYLLPYNRKIWKRDPAEMDTQMVSRIPRPPDQHIIDAAAGRYHQGYLHQAHFWYPERGGMASLIHGLARHPDTIASIDRCRFGAHVTGIWREGDAFVVNGDFATSKGTNRHSGLVSTLPLPRLAGILDPPPPEHVEDAVDRLTYIGIHVTVVTATNDILENRFSVTIADPEVPFHRVTKLDFLGDPYWLRDRSTFLVEESFRPEEPQPASAKVAAAHVQHLDRIGFVQHSNVVSAISRRFQHAYPVYDLNHRKSVDTVLDWVRSLGIISLGRFGQWEYMNMDRVLQEAEDVAV